MYRVAKDMVDLVGYTPLVKINHIVPNKKVKVYAKLERYNPAGSVKDRIAKYMIEYGEREGLLTKDKIVIEPTSGNTGIALAMVCAVKRYRLELVMPERISIMCSPIMRQRAKRSGERPKGRSRCLLQAWGQPEL